MLRNIDRKWLGFGISSSLALALVACVQKGSSVGAVGTGGDQSSSPVVGSPAAGSAAPSPSVGTSSASTGGASAQTGTAGTLGQPSAGSSGGMATATGGATPTGGVGGTMSSAGSGGAAGAAGMTAAREDLGKGDGSDVVTIGDSWMQIATNGGGIEGGLDRAGTMYRHYAVPGTLLNGTIPGQYDQAKAVNPKIATVIMTGGGNDIMFSNGCATKESCMMAVQTIVDELDVLWTKFAADGVTDVVFISYSKNAGTAPSDTRPDTVPVPTICTTGKIHCHSINTDAEVGPGDTVDGIHPTLAACDLIAKKVLDELAATGARR